ncbi:MAG: tetratricopeptide repeat protein [Planctomycetes bacterium]|nr:tetratricopeptide repeat protein [Planctomycetota bacterium]
MIRSTPILIACLLLCPIVASAAGEELAEARQLLLGGKYDEARAIYASKSPQEPAAAVGHARCLAAVGKLDEAVAALQLLAQDHAEVQAEWAALAFRRGDFRAVDVHCEAAIKLDRDQLQARWLRAESARLAGRPDEAQRDYAWFLEYYNGRDVEDAESLHWIGLAAAQYARWNRLHQQFRFLVNELYPDALAAEPAYWPAHYESGLLLLEKYNFPDSADEFEAALAINPAAAEVHAALGRLALEKRDIEKAQASADRALEINPKLLDAWLLKADLAWANFQPREAARLLREEALSINPRSQEALGRLGAYLMLHENTGGRHPAPATDPPAEQTAAHARGGTFSLAKAHWLQDRHRFDLAQKCFRRAIEQSPRRIGPRAELGLLYMRVGHEADARVLLKKAFEIDPFNVRVNNMLEVLEVLDGYQTLQTPHFLIRFDPGKDRVLADYAGLYLEELYPQFCRQFGYEPSKKFLIEIFNSADGQTGHNWFSTRMTGLPYIGTVGACAGRMVAIVSPGDEDDEHKRRFNWAEVLKHETVHLFTLEQTHFNIPHWYTEALAVLAEDCPRSARWNTLLEDRVPEGDLFDLETINFGFTRPNSSDDWQMAYCQAELYAQYMTAAHGEESLGKLLQAYADGLDTPEAIRRATGAEQADFEKGYVAYLEETVAGLSSLATPEPRKFAELQEAHRTDPADVEVAARLAFSLLRRREFKEASAMAEAALKLQPRHPLATYVAARMKVRGEKTDEAVAMLQQCLDTDAPEPNGLQLLAELKLQGEEFDEAARLFALGQKHEEANLQWTKSLVEVYEAAGNRPKLIENLTRLARAESADVDWRTRLTKLALKEKDFAHAAQWARRALEIDVADAALHRMFAESLSGEGRFVRAIEEFEIAVNLDPDDSAARFGWAKACRQAQRPREAIEVLEDLLQRVPDFPGAAQMLEEIEEAATP